MMNPKLIGGLIGAAVVAGGAWWVLHPRPAPVFSTAMSSTLQRQNRAEALRIGHSLSPGLQASHGVITPALAGLTRTSLPSRFNSVVGIRREWQRVNMARFQHLPHQLTDGIVIPQAIWEAGWRQAAQDALTAAGNDPLAVLQNAGPGSASHFASLVKALYQWDTQSGSAHWMSHMIADVGGAGSAGTIMIYPATHQIPQDPRVLTLMVVPVSLTEYGDSPWSGLHRRTAVQTATATMALTHVHHRWQWWIEALRLGPQNTVSFDYAQRG